MKSKGKIFIGAFSVLLLSLCMLFSGCVEPEQAKVKLLYQSGETVSSFEVPCGEFADKTLLDVLETEQYAGTIQADIDKSNPEMPFLNSIFGMTPDWQKNEFIALYTTLSDFSMGEEFEITVSEKTFYSADKGIKEIPIREGAEYLFKLTSFEIPEKVDPEYTIPVLDAIAYDSEKTLDDVVLPAGWSWNEPATVPTVAVDKYKATFTPEDTYTYNSVVKDVPLTVNKGTYSGIAHEALSGTYDAAKTLADYTLEGGFAWVDDTVVPSVGENGYAAKYNADAANYNDFSLEITIDVARAKIGEFIFSLEATTVGRGYIVEPTKVDILDGENGAQMLLRVLEKFGLTCSYTGRPESGFYLSKVKNISGMSAYLTEGYLETVVNQKYIDEVDSFEALSKDGELGEMDFTFMSGWMYMVNNSMLGFGFSDYAPKEGDVVRVQFSLYGFGADLTEGFAGDSMFPVVNRDALVAKIAEINAAGKQSAYGAAYTSAKSLLESMGVTQDALDEALAALLAAEKSA